jgi:ferrochelatase
MSERRVAVVLFNLGGPDGPADVARFLFNLFADRAIIDLPGPARLPLAAVIAAARGPRARANYGLMGGGSPLLAGTRAQAGAVEEALSRRMAGATVKAFVAMRYWAPASEETAAEVAAFGPDEVVLAPLYPQYSTTTTASSLAAWKRAYGGPGRVRGLCCWHDAPGLVEAHARLILETWEGAGRPKARLLFSAHGLPLAVAARGDPYAWQVEATSAAIAGKLGPGWDWQVCYQSRVGPMKWLGPSTPEAIAAAAADGLGVLIDPVSFVSEHVETLVELDRDYAALAKRAGAPCYLRVPAMGVGADFIDALAAAVARALARPGIGPAGAACPARFGRCGRTREAA